MAAPASKRRSLKTILNSLLSRKGADKAREPSSSVHQSAADQAQSPFFDRLPLDIRILVYTACFDLVVHLYQSQSRIIRINGPDSDVPIPWDGHRRRLGSSSTGSLVDREDTPKDGLLSLILTCRKAYGEALSYLLATPRFTIHQPALLASTIVHRIKRLDFAVYFHRFPQVTINTQEDISMPQWRSICLSLAELTNLTCLTITLHQNYFFVEQRGTPEIASLVVGVLQPLKQIRPRGGMDKFEVRIGWILADEERLGLGQCPFRIVEVGKRTFGGV